MMKKSMVSLFLIFVMIGSLFAPISTKAEGVELTTISTSLYHSIALDSSGTIWAWGRNHDGQFGNGTESGSTTPIRIDTPVSFRQAVAGFYHSIALDAEQHIWTVGRNEFGELGNGTAESSSHWSMLDVSLGGNPVKFNQVAANRVISAALDEHGRLWTWGLNFTTVPTELPVTDSGTPVRFTSISANELMLVAIDTNHQLWQINNTAYAEKLVPDSVGMPPKFRAVSVGSGLGNSGSLAVALDDEDNIWIWGTNTCNIDSNPNYPCGQQGDGGADPDPRTQPTMLEIMDGGSPVKFEQVSGGSNYVLALDKSGNLWGWGMNNYGQLGDGTMLSGQPPKKIEVMGSGGPITFASVSAGYGRSLGLTADGRVWAWGEFYDTTPSKLLYQPRVSLSASPVNSSSIMEQVTLTAVVSGDVEAPSGTVEFYSGGTLLGSRALVGGTASLDTSSLQSGTHSLQAHYVGDENYEEGQSEALSHTVNALSAPVITLTATPTDVTFGEVTVSATVVIDGVGFGNTLTQLKWLPGSRGSSDFAGNGVDITSEASFSVSANGIYTVYARDLAGTESVRTIEVTNILEIDSSALVTALSEARQALIDHPIGTNVGEAPSSAHDTLLAAIDVAQSELDDAANRTQAQLDTATDDLGSALAAFRLSVVVAGDSSALVTTLGEARQSLIDHPIGTNVGEAPSSAHASLLAAIDVAQSELDDAANRTQAQLDIAVSNLNTALTAFRLTILVAGDASALVTALGEARQALIDHPVGTNVGEAPTSAHGALQAAIDVAQEVADDASNCTQAQLDTATDDLNTALTAFRLTILVAGDASALVTALGEARQELIDHPVGMNVGEAPSSAHVALQAAIDVAQEVADDASNRTQAQLDTTTDDLGTAVAAFRLSVVVAGDSSALVTTLSEARQALIDHPIGTNVGETSSSAHDALQAAIDVAQSELDAASYRTQAQLDTATDDLGTAIAAFRLSVVLAGDSSALVTALGEARQSLIDHPIGANVGETSSSAHDALQAAIDAAQSELDAATSRTQAQLDTALDDLNLALAAFRLSVVVAGDSSALVTVLGEARQALIDHPIGTNVGETSSSAHDALQAAIDVAQSEADVAASRTQAQLDSAADDLKTALAAFRLSVLVAGDASVLQTALGTARQALIDHPIGTNVGEASSSAHDALQAAIDVAQEVADDAAGRTQAQLDTALDDLNTALAAFRLTVVGIAMSGPEAGLYGPSEQLTFTLAYREEVIVSGMPQLALTLGNSSVTEAVYASYTGTSGEALTRLTFLYHVPTDIIANGMTMSSRVYFPDGASIDLVSGGMALQDFVAPDLSGIRMVSFPPELELDTDHAEGRTAEVTVTASAYGELEVGNELIALRLLQGVRQAVDFAEGNAGVDLLVKRSFTVDENDHYTVYARDAVGNEAVRTIQIDSIIRSTPGFIPRRYVIRLTSDSSVRQWTWTERELEKVERVELDGRTMHPNPATVWTLSVPRDTADLLLRGTLNDALIVRTDLGDYELSVAVFEELSDQPYSELRFTLSQVSAEDRHDLDRASTALGAVIHDHPLQLNVSIVVAGQEQTVSHFGHYLALTTPVSEALKQQSMLVALYDAETNSFVAVPSALDKTSAGVTMNWRTRTGGLYTVLSYHKEFDDMQGSWAEATVTQLASKLIVNGVDHTNFAPQAFVTRAEFTAMVVRALGLQSERTIPSRTFSDVGSDSWYASAIEAAAREGIVTGNDGLFRPNEPINRQEAVTLLLNALRFVVGDDASRSGMDVELDAYIDAEQISFWAREQMVSAVRVGLIQGYPDGSLRPQEQITRAEAAVMIARMLRSIGFLEFS